MTSGVSSTSQVTVGGVTHSNALKNYSQTVGINGSVVTGSLSGTVETTSTKLGANGGSYTVATPTPVVWNAATRALTAGVVKVVGAGNSQLVMTVGSNNTVTIQIDANGDGMFEKTVSSTASELASLL